jgi:hypothetical protein
MLETIEAMSLRTIMEIVGPVLLLVALVYGTIQWSSRRRRRIDAVRQAATRNLHREGAGDERLARNLAPAGSFAQGRTADEAPAQATPAQRMPNPKILGKLRSGREDSRLSEDDIAREHMGPRGLPGEPARTIVLDEKEAQIPKPLDPGHTA